MNEQSPNPYAAPESNLETAQSTDGIVLAKRLTRLIAAIVDGVVGLIVTLPIFYLMGMFDVASSASMGLGMIVLMVVMGLLGFLVIHGYFLHTSGQTIGKKLFGIQIVSYSTNKILPLSKVFLLRYVPLNVVGSIPLIGSILILVDLLFIFGKEQRCVHDLIAGTKVIKKHPSATA